MKAMKPETPVYPNIADDVLKKVLIPVLPKESRMAYVRPDTIRMYIPPELDQDSDEDTRREKQRNQLKKKFIHKRLDRVTKKFKNATGQVKYTVLWENNPVEEVVPSEALQDHDDWDLVQHFEYQQAIRQSIRMEQ